MNTRTTREGDILTVALADEIGADPTDGKWVVMCEKHDTLVGCSSRREALSIRALDFCEEC